MRDTPTTPPMGTALTGVGVYPGRVTGPLVHMPLPSPEPSRQPERMTGDRVVLEVRRLREAGARVAAELRQRTRSASLEAGAVLEATAMMATDTTLHTAAERLMRKGLSGERALWEAAGGIAEQFRTLGGYMADRVTDILDVRSRIVAALRGLEAPRVPDHDAPFVLAAHDLAPADAATLDPATVIALVTSEGSPESHTAMLAASLRIPTVVALGSLSHLLEGARVHVDGGAGVVVTESAAKHDAPAAGWMGDRTVGD